MCMGCVCGGQRCKKPLDLVVQVVEPFSVAGNLTWILSKDPLPLAGTWGLQLVLGIKEKLDRPTAREKHRL